ncbi:MAG: hypothetical protein AAF993_22615 [Pseudomonadota bacterium]
MLLLICQIAPIWATGDDELLLPDPRHPYLHVKSTVQVGNKGEEVFDVSLAASSPHCGRLWVFDHAEIKVHQQRFADVQVIALPEAGCRKCKPGVVRWYHEPTGHLDFSVFVYRRQVDIACSDGAVQAAGQTGARTH